MAKRYGHIGQDPMRNVVTALEVGANAAAPADVNKKSVKSERPASREKQNQNRRKTAQGAI
jgi:hypothetical protein